MRPQKLLARDDDEREHTKLLLKGFESDGESSLNRFHWGITNLEL